MPPPACSESIADWTDSTSVALLRTFVDAQGAAEIGKGQFGIVAVNDALSVATTLSGVINGKRINIQAINGADRWFPEIAAGVAAVLCSETRAAKPFNGLEVIGIDAPPVEKRWTPAELKTAYDNGVTPLSVNGSEKVALGRVITSRFKNDAGNPDYTLLDMPIMQGLDRTRDVIVEMLDRDYQRVNWADDPVATDDYPSDVVYPSKANDNLYDKLLQLQAEGTLQNVAKLRTQQLVEKEGSQLRFSVPADVIDGMHEKYGAIVLVRNVAA